MPDKPIRKKAKPVTPQAAAETAAPSVDHDRIARLAYELWQRRGCPTGSPDEDWTQAERAIRQTATAS